MSTYASGTETTIYVGEQLEKLTTPVRAHWKHLPADAVGEVQVIRRSDGTSETLYLASDHLGSVDAVLDGTGAVLARPSFTAWGARRSSSWQGAPSQSEWQAIANHTRRGYTGHEQLDNVLLVHMNGRVYDPAVGRFLSADPYIDGESDPQGWNRYGYVQNRPLSRTDPSGYASVRGTGQRTQLRDGSKEVSDAQEIAYGLGSLAWQRQWGNAYSEFGGMAPIWSFSGPGWMQQVVLGGGGQFRGSAAGQWSSEWLDRDCPGCGWTGKSPDGLLEEIGVGGKRSVRVWNRVLARAGDWLNGDCGKTVNCMAFPMWGGPQGAAATAARGTTTLYRAVSAAEHADIATTGVLRAGPNSIEAGKWFAESAADARRWGTLMDGAGNFRVIEATFPRSVADQFLRNPRLDGIGPARFGTFEQLGNPIIKLGPGP